MQHPSYRPDIDGLRAIAVLLVVVHHAFPKLLPSGFIGVDLFFVISGFLITTIIFQNLERGSFSFLDFYTRRIKRIFPALALVLLACLVYGWFTLLPADYKLLGKHTIAGAAFVSNFAFWNESGYFNGDSKLKPLLHLWSLGIEEQYYIFWPLIAWFAWKKQFNLLKVSVLLLIVSLIINIVTVKYNAVAAFFSPASRFWELLAGSVLAYVALHRPAQRQAVNQPLRNNQAAWAGFLLLLIGVALIKPERRFPGFWAILPTLSAYLIIYAGPQAWLNRQVFSNKLLVWFGLISFPLYLWHWPLLVFAKLSANQAPGTELLLAAVALSIVLAWLTYRLVERPIRFGSQTRLIPIVLCFILLALAAGGRYIYKNEGFESRFPSFIRAILHNQPKLAEGWRSNECILEQGVPSSNFSSSCVDKDKRPLVFLWGDSHAAALYPGFKHLQDTGLYNFGVAQRNGAVCPPILGDARPWCNEINTDSFRLIKELKPEIAVLYAYWPHGMDGNGNFGGLYDLTKLDNTVLELKKAGVQKIILMGPSPYWKNSLPHNIVETWKKGNPLSKPPLRMGKGEFGLLDNLHVYEKRMRDLATQMGVDYISGLDYLCNEDGCLTRDSEDGVKVSSVDYGHLTVDASQTYLKMIAPLIFAKPTNSPVQKQ